MKYILILFTTLTLTSCNWFRKKGKETVNKTGEVVAKTGSEFADGVSKGIEKTFTNEVVLSDQLKNAGLTTGKILVGSSDSATDNIISAYLVFNKDFEKEITVKVFDENGQEYGRVKQLVRGKKDEANYTDFIFDKRTNIESKGRVTFE
jgi:hypothetical protein